MVQLRYAPVSEWWPTGTHAEQGGQPERRAGRFYNSKVFVRRPVTFGVRRQQGWRIAMLQVIGLIVAVYAMVRVIQVPIEMTANKEEWLGLPFTVRFFILAGVSAGGLLVLGILTLMLLASGSQPAPPFTGR